MCAVGSIYGMLTKMFSLSKLRRRGVIETLETSGTLCVGSFYSVDFRSNYTRQRHKKISDVETLTKGKIQYVHVFCLLFRPVSLTERKRNRNFK